jgi:hypothetical protein
MLNHFRVSVEFSVLVPLHRGTGESVVVVELDFG